MIGKNNMHKLRLVTAEWCGPCYMVKKMIERKGLKVSLVDMDEDPELLREFGITSVPTLLIKESNGDFRLVKGTDDIISEIENNK
tara:strand:+ start:1074 stop:1328 length:255 start_codon:yes stop_codon:yes gene_type:complete